MISIKEKLLKKNYNWNNETIEILEKYFSQLDDTLGSVIDVNSIFDYFIKSDNLKNGIIYVDEKMIDGKFDAVYNFKDLCIRISDNESNKDYLNYLLFHELTHVVSKHDDYIGFSNLTNNNVGINEGTTELISMLRNNKIGFKFKNEGMYNIVTSLSYLLANILEFKDFFNAYFNDYKSLEKLVEQKNMNYIQILKCFDYFIDKEKYFIKMNFSDEMKDYTRMITYNFYDSFGEIDSVEKFDKKMKFISLYIKTPFSLNYIDEYFTYMEILIDKNKLLDLEISESYIDNILRKYDLYNKEKFDKYINIYNEDISKGSE